MHYFILPLNINDVILTYFNYSRTVLLYNPSELFLHDNGKIKDQDFIIENILRRAKSKIFKNIKFIINLAYFVRVLSGIVSSQNIYMEDVTSSTSEWILI